MPDSGQQGQQGEKKKKKKPLLADCLNLTAITFIYLQLDLSAPPLPFSQLAALAYNKRFGELSILSVLLLLELSIVHNVLLYYTN